MHYPGARLTPKKNFSGLILKKFIKLDFKNEPTQKFFEWEIKKYIDSFNTFQRYTMLKVLIKMAHSCRNSQLIFLKFTLDHIKKNLNRIVAKTGLF